MLADDSMTNMAMGGDAQNQNRIYVNFYRDSVQDHAASGKEGRPIFKEVDFIEKIAPGGKNNIVKRPVREKDKAEFRQQWQNYEAGQDSSHLVGTPLTECPAFTKSQIEELKFWKIYTVEQIIDAPDTVSMMGINMLKDAAKKYLALAEGKSVNEKMLEEKLAERDEQLAAMQAQIDALAFKHGEPVIAKESEETPTTETTEGEPTKSRRKKRS